METMANRLTALVVTYLESSSITWNSLSNPQALQSIYSKDKKIDKSGKAGL